MAKTINFKVAERFGIQNILSEAYQKGGLTLTTLTDAQNLLRKMALDIKWNEKADKDGVIWAKGEEEAKKVRLRQTFSFGQGGRTSSLMWDAQRDQGVAIEITDDECKLIKDIIDRKNTEKGFSLSDNYIVELAKKLEGEKK